MYKNFNKILLCLYEIWIMYTLHVKLIWLHCCCIQMCSVLFHTCVAFFFLHVLYFSWEAIAVIHRWHWPVVTLTDRHSSYFNFSYKTEKGTSVLMVIIGGFPTRMMYLKHDSRDTPFWLETLQLWKRMLCHTAGSNFSAMFRAKKKFVIISQLCFVQKKCNFAFDYVTCDHAAFCCF